LLLLAHADTFIVYLRC